VTDAGLDRLKGLARLETLNLAGTRATDDGMGRLTGLARLKGVNVTFTRVTLAGIGRLERVLPGVRVSSLPGQWK
jgi:hypothetical protein